MNNLEMIFKTYFDNVGNYETFASEFLTYFGLLKVSVKLFFFFFLTIV